MMVRHMTIEQLPYGKPVCSWLKDRYGEAEANKIWEQTQENYRNYLIDLPDYGGSKNGHAKAIYGGLLIFALYPALPDQPPVSELQGFIQNLFMGPFTKLGKIFDLNRPSHMWLIDKVFRKSGNRDRKDILRYPDGFINVDVPYDKEHHTARYSFTQCPNAEFAKKHGLLHVLPLLCNSDFFGISEIHGTLIRCGTCGNSDACDYLVVGSSNPIAREYETMSDERGFLVSRKRVPENVGEKSSGC
ncbi:MAG: L-2-amino-thiazoline-4-carboxylic acid hydrolase [Lachnospiraceae bacterium]|nr:L-2-amino-thiazoline-4-carboxylic acid hydrolase [Lachnospiraceae bacterium]